jgi:hypothetical protein
MKLLGCGSITELNRSFIDIPATWPTGSEHRQPVA